MSRIYCTLAVLLALLPLAASAQDISHSEKKMQDQLAVMERNIAYLEKQLELAEATHDIEKKKLDISELKKKRAEAELAASQANAERLASKISQVEAVVRRVAAPEESCDASAYILFHCKGKTRCEFDLDNKDMCKLPAEPSEEMIVSVLYRCAGAESFSSETFPFDAPKGFLTCF